LQLGIRPMACEAMRRKDGQDVASILHFLSLRVNGCNECKRDDKQDEPSIHGMSWKKCKRQGKASVHITQSIGTTQTHFFMARVSKLILAVASGDLQDFNLAATKGVS